MEQRGQGAFEYLLMIGGIVLVATVVIIMVQGSTSGVNNALIESSNDYLSALSNQQQSIQNDYISRYKTPAGCAYSNPPCGDGLTCNPASNACGAPANTTLNGCAYANPSCPSGYACTVTNTCLPS
jgi:hypothetical protein